MLAAIAPLLLAFAGTAPAAVSLAPVDPMAQVTGAVTRRFPADPGPIQRMWFVYDNLQELSRSQDMLSRIETQNPGVEITYYKKSDLLASVEEDGTLNNKQAQALYDRIKEEHAEFILGSNHDIYETIHSLRDSGFDQDIPFGFAGRRFVSVDIPRASLNPEALSDPRSLPHRKYLFISEDASLPLPDEDSAGMRGSRATLEEILNDPRRGEGKPKVDIPLLKRIGLWLQMRLSGEADPKAMRELRSAAQCLAAYLEDRQIDVLVTDDPVTSRLAGQMKREGYHLSLPIVWQGEKGPEDSSGINAAFKPAQDALAKAIREAPALKRLPDNFGAEGGVTVKDYEEMTRRVLEHPAVPGIPEGEILFLLSSGNGDKRKGDMNAYGHMAMAIKDEKGAYRVWTVQYNDRRGAPITGGLGENQLTLGEYLYGVHHAPGTASPASVLAQTSVGRVWAFVLRGIDKDQLGAMYAKAADLNEAHLAEKTAYEFINWLGINCTSMIESLARAALFRISRSRISVPADKAVDLMKTYFWSLLDNQIKGMQTDLILFDRPAHAGSSYRIPNIPLGSPFLNFRKTWKEMTWWERVRTLLRRPLEFFDAPRYIAAFSAMATRRVFVEPNSRALNVESNPDSPLSRLNALPETMERLKTESMELRRKKLELRETIAKRLGLQGWQLNPEQDLSAEDAELRRDIAEFKELDIRQKLNQLDQILLMRQELFLKIKIADFQGKYASRLHRIERVYRRVLVLREKIEAEHRLPTQEEIRELSAISEWGEAAFYDLRVKLLKYFGQPPPQDITAVFEEAVTADELAKLRGKPLSASTSRPLPAP